MSKTNQRLQPAMPLAQLLTIAQVADLLNIHRATVYSLIKHNGLPVMKLGNRSTRVNAIRLQQWIDERAGLSA